MLYQAKPFARLSRKFRERLRAILESALQVTGDMGTLQLLDPSRSCLTIVCSHGFDRKFLTFFNTTHEGHAACGMALLRRERVLVPDVAQSPIFVETQAQAVLLNAGVRAVQSTPFLNGSGAVLGVLSTHYRKCGTPSVRELIKIDRLARYAADLIERQASLSSHSIPAPEERPELTGEYSLFCRTNGCVSFMEAIKNWREAIDRMERLSLLEAGEFILFRDLCVVAVSRGGIVELRPNWNRQPDAVDYTPAASYK